MDYYGLPMSCRGIDDWGPDQITSTSIVPIDPGFAWMSHTVPKDEEFVRVWYMRARVGKWKVVLIKDLGYDCERVVAEDIVVLYDNKCTMHPINQGFHYLFGKPPKEMRGACLLAKRDPITGNYIDMEQCDLEKLKEKKEVIVSLAQEMPLEPIPLSGSGNSFEDSNVSEDKKVALPEFSLAEAYLRAAGNLV